MHGRTDGGDPELLRQERIARNDATFRDANERIRDKAEAHNVDPIPFICECADPSCTAIVQLTIEQYEEIRADPRHFLNVPGHEIAAQGYGEVVATRDGYVIVRKLGHAGDVVEDLDERTGEKAQGT